MKTQRKILPRTLPGFMELQPNEQVVFNQMKAKIEESYKRFGFLPLDTPVLELSEVLLAKAGGETEKQIYRFTRGDTDMSMRFDLTVPLAKYVAQNYEKLQFPFRRYQIGKVYRGERPQRGRFREFYQADIDIIGDGELNILNDAEIPSIIYTTFKKLGFYDFTIRINNRKILNGFFENLELVKESTDIMRIIDKIEKIGEDNVKLELLELGIVEKNVIEILKFISINGNNDEKLKQLEKLNINNKMFNQGLMELKEVVKYIRLFGVPESNFNVDLTIARGPSRTCARRSSPPRSSPTRRASTRSRPGLPSTSGASTRVPWLASGARAASSAPPSSTTSPAPTRPIRICRCCWPPSRLRPASRSARPRCAASCPRRPSPAFRSPCSPRPWPTSTRFARRACPPPSSRVSATSSAPTPTTG